LEFVSFGYWVRRQRLALDLTQAALARQVGCATVTIKKIERDERRLSRTMAERLAESLEIPEAERQTFIRWSLGEAVTSGMPLPAAPIFQAQVGGYSLVHTKNEIPVATRQDAPIWEVASVPSHNLPVQPTRFIGREGDIAQVKALLVEHALVTLTGSGGVGKSRLSLRVAEDLVADFQDGVWQVELAAITDPDLVVYTVANTLGLREEANYSIQVNLENYLKSRQMLLVLDNCEHLIESCATLVARLLRFCPQLKLLASSRELLGVPGEARYRLPSLALPESQGQLEIQQITQYDAIRLFVDRAQAVMPSFQVTPGNAAYILRICKRLDGIPLALELAAVRLNMLDTQQLDIRLEKVFHILTGGARTALPRHRTLYATIDWSYQLLDEKQQTLLRRLSVFAADWDLESAEAVCHGEGLEETEILDLLTELVNKSIVILDQSQGKQTRYRLLETVHLFAQEKLVEIEDVETLRIRHADHYLGMAETYAAMFNLPDEMVWQKRIDVNLPNIRSALAWALEGNSVGKGIAAALALWDIYYWLKHGLVNEGCAWLEKAASLMDPNRPSLDLGRLWIHQGYILEYQGRHNEAYELLQSSRDMFEELGSRLDYAKATQRLGLAAKDIGERTTAWEKASAYFAESAAIFKELGVENYLAYVTYFWGVFEPQYGGDLERALELLTETERLYQKLGAIQHTYGEQGMIYWRKGQKQRARTLLEKELLQVREMGDLYGLMYVLCNLGEFELQEATDYAGLRKAEAFLREGLDLVRKISGGFDYFSIIILRLARKAQSLGQLVMACEWYAAALSTFMGLAPIFKMANLSTAGKCLLGLAEVAASQNALDYSARLLGALAGLQTVAECLWEDISRKDFDCLTQAVRQQLDEANFQQSWEEGQAMTMDSAVAYALQGRVGNF
jgi:non-specific serine/threonine protein kinase